MTNPSSAGWPGRVAIGVVRSDVPKVVLAESDEVLSRVLALEVVAQTAASEVRDRGLLERIRESLLQESWATAVMYWIEATGEAVDAYPDEPVWTEQQLDLEEATLEIRVSPIFDEGSH